MHRLMFGLLLVYLSGCAHGPTLQQRLQQRLDSHIGQNIDDIIERFGPPAQTYQLNNGNKVYIFRSQGPTVTRAEPIPWNFSGQRQLVSQTAVCETQYTTNGVGTILWGTARGNCR